MEGIFELNSSKVTERRKKSKENGRIVVGWDEMREEGLGIRGGPKKDRSLKGISKKITGGWH